MQEMFQELPGAGKAGCIRKLPLDAALDAAYINFMTVIDEHLEFIRMMVRENGVREFLSEEEVRSIWKNRIPWLPTLLKRKMEAGEVKEMDFEMAALSVNSILMHYVMKRVTDTGHSTLDDKAWRKRLVDYQVSVWSVENSRKMKRARIKNTGKNLEDKEERKVNHMWNLLKDMRKKDKGLAFLAVLLIAGQVFLDLKLPDYTKEITVLISSESNTISDYLLSGGKMLACALGSALLAVIVELSDCKDCSRFQSQCQRKSIP